VAPDRSDRSGRTAAFAVGGVVLAALLTFGVHVGNRPAPVLRARQVDTVAAAPTPGDDPSSRPARSSDTSAYAGVSPSWVSSTSVASGVPAGAVRAYGAATLREAAEDPGCHLGWTTLAGIGWVESQHGTIDGRTLLPDGRPDRPILGVELDGSGDVAAVPDASGGYQRAVGPLQFIPDTWRRWAADGDGDGRDDPQDLDDAALAAARYLCASGADLTSGTGWSDAVFSYNHSNDYVQAVYAAAKAYADRTR
jgi:membrane-bound lytic murein transglycosylase B